jgi:hypothetical protein
VSALKLCGIKVCSVYPYFWIKYYDLSVASIIIYVDDCLVIGTDEGIDNLINNLRDYNFGLKVSHNLTDYLICMIHEDMKRKQHL